MKVSLPVVLIIYSLLTLSCNKEQTQNGSGFQINNADRNNAIGTTTGANSKLGGNTSEITNGEFNSEKNLIPGNGKGSNMDSVIESKSRSNLQNVSKSTVEENGIESSNASTSGSYSTTTSAASHTSKKKKKSVPHSGPGATTSSPGAGSTDGRTNPEEGQQ